jgi:hypothetical protein
VDPSADIVPPANRRWRLLRLVVLALAYLALVRWLSWPLLSYPAKLLPAFTNYTFRYDPEYTIWALSWETHILATAPSHLFDANIFHPVPTALLYGPTVFGALPYFAPVFGITGNPVLAVNLMYFFGVAATALAVHLVAVAWTGAEIAGVAAGVVFLSHAWLWNWLPSSPHYVILFYLPLIVFLAAGRLSARRGVLLAVLVVLQSLVEPVYIGPAVCAPLAVIALCRLVRPARRAEGVRLAAVLTASAFAVLPIYLGYRSIRAANPGLLHQTYWGSTEFIQFLLPVSISAYGIYGYAPFDTSSVVFVLVAMGAGALWITRSGPPDARTKWLDATVWSVVGLVLSTRVLKIFGLPQFELPYFTLVHALFPTLTAIVRIHARLGLGALIGVPLLAGLAVDACGRAARRWGPWAGRIVPVVLVVLVGGVLYRDLRTAVPRFNMWVGPEVDRVTIPVLQRGQGAVVEVPIDSEPEHWGGLGKPDVGGPVFAARAMYRSIFHWRPLLNGYSSFYPARFPERMALARRLPDPDAVAALARDAGLSTIVVHIHDLHGDERTRWMDARRGRTDLRLVAQDGLMEAFMQHLVFEVSSPGTETHARDATGGAQPLVGYVASPPTTRPYASTTGRSPGAGGFGRRAIARSTWGASCSAFRWRRASCRSANSGMTRVANSSSDAQMSSCRLLPPCWMNTA